MRLGTRAYLSAGALALSFSDNGRWLALAGGQPFVRLLEVQFPQQMSVYPGAFGWVSFFPGRDRVLAWSQNGFVDFEPGQESDLNLEPSSVPLCVSLSADGWWLAWTVGPEMIHVCNMRTGEVVLRMEVAGLRHLALSRAGQFLYWCASDRAGLVDTASQSRVASLNPLGRAVWTDEDELLFMTIEGLQKLARPWLAPALGGEVLDGFLSCTRDGVWAAFADRERVRIWREGEELSPVEASCACLAWFGEGHWLAGSSLQGPTRLWRVEPGPDLSIELPELDDWGVLREWAPPSVGFSPDGRWELASASPDWWTLRRYGSPLETDFEIGARARFDSTSRFLLFDTLVWCLDSEQSWHLPGSVLAVHPTAPRVAIPGEVWDLVERRRLFDIEPAPEVQFSCAGELAICGADGWRAGGEVVGVGTDQFVWGPRGTFAIWGWSGARVGELVVEGEFLAVALTSRYLWTVQRDHSLWLHPLGEVPPRDFPGPYAEMAAFDEVVALTFLEGGLELRDGDGRVITTGEKPVKKLEWVGQHLFTYGEGFGQLWAHLSL